MAVKNSFAVRSRGHLFHDLVLISFSVAGAGIIMVGFFIYSKMAYQTAVFSRTGNYTTAASGIHASAREKVLPDIKSRPAEVLQITPEKTGTRFVAPGEQNVMFMQFGITAPRDGYLERLVFTLDDFARPYDVSQLQLYHEQKLLGTVPFLEGKALFQNLHLQLAKNDLSSFEVRGKISQQAMSGDRIRIGFKSMDAVKFQSDEALDIVAGSFPVWSQPISVIGEQL